MKKILLVLLAVGGAVVAKRKLGTLQASCGEPGLFSNPVLDASVLGCVFPGIAWLYRSIDLLPVLRAFQTFSICWPLNLPPRPSGGPSCRIGVDLSAMRRRPKSFQPACWRRLLSARRRIHPGEVARRGARMGLAHPRKG